MASANKVVYTYQQPGSTTVTTAFGSVVNASAMGDSQCGKLMYSNTTAQPMVLGLSPTSTVSSATAYMSIPVTTNPVVVDVLIPARNYIFLKSVGASTTSGEITLDFFTM
jgi:hypothetical protein